jgi:hypothetical protein
MWRVCAVALSLVSGWRAFSSISLCTYMEEYGRIYSSIFPIYFYINLEELVQKHQTERETLHVSFFGDTTVSLLPGALQSRAHS